MSSHELYDCVCACVCVCMLGGGGFFLFVRNQPCSPINITETRKTKTRVGKPTQANLQNKFKFFLNFLCRRQTCPGNISGRAQQPSRRNQKRT